jgi:hypothetical protein
MAHRAPRIVTAQGDHSAVEIASPAFHKLLFAQDTSGEGAAATVLTIPAVIRYILP